MRVQHASISIVVNNNKKQGIVHVRRQSTAVQQNKNIHTTSNRGQNEKMRKEEKIFGSIIIQRVYNVILKSPTM